MLKLQFRTLNIILFLVLEGKISYRMHFYKVTNEAKCKSFPTCIAANLHISLKIGKVLKSLSEIALVKEHLSAI
jgi:hypothetical protein